MHTPARWRNVPEHLHIFGDNQRCQDIAHPIHLIGPQPLGVIVFDEAPEPPVPDGSDNHPSGVYGITVRFAKPLRFLCVFRSA